MADDEKDDIQQVEDTSIRGAIRAAIDEVQEDGPEDRQDTKVSRSDDTERKVSARKEADDNADADAAKKSATDKARDQSGRFQKGSPEQVLDKGDVKDTKGDDKQVSTAEKPEDKAAQAAAKPPVSWSKEGKAAWNTLPADVQKSVLKREEEFSNGIRMYSEKAKAFDELDQVITPYKAQIQQFGVTPAQTVAKLFEWMNALGHPNQEYKRSAFETLAKSFGFDVENLAPRPNNIYEDQQQTFDPSLISQVVQQELAPVRQTLTQYQQQQEEQARARAASEMQEWSKDKPYFDQVRTSMYNLITSGEVPLTEDGRLDLDGAYEKAVWLNPEVRESLQQDQAQKAAQEAQEKANREAAERVARLKKAQQVGVGIKPSAPSMRAVMNGAPRQPAPGQKVSVRDSLRLSMQQLREGE